MRFSNETQAGSALTGMKAMTTGATSCSLGKPAPTATRPWISL